ncbi:MAG: VOC family protein [Rubrobacteraceae bacterium]
MVSGLQEVQVVEALGHGELPGLGDAGDELIPGQDLVQHRVRVSAAPAGRDEGLAEPSVESALLVYGLAVLSEALVAHPLGLIHESADYPDVHLQRRVRELGGSLCEVGDERGATPQVVEAPQVLGRGLRPLAGQPCKPVVVDGFACIVGKRQRPQELQAPEDLFEVLGRGRVGGLLEGHGGRCYGGRGAQAQALGQTVAYVRDPDGVLVEIGDEVAG